MKISVCGNIIDTQDIYQIKPIKIEDYVSMGENIGGYNKTMELDKADRIKFSILSMNKNEFCISQPLYELNNLKEKQLEYNKMVILRQKVIDYWNKDKTTIPLLEL